MRQNKKGLHLPGNFVHVVATQYGTAVQGTFKPAQRGGFSQPFSGLQRARVGRLFQSRHVLPSSRPTHPPRARLLATQPAELPSLVTVYCSLTVPNTSLVIRPMNC